MAGRGIGSLSRTVLIVLALAAGQARAAEPVRLALLGDSLTAGYGLKASEAFPARLEAALRDAGVAVEVVDAGISGDTTAGGLARLDWLLAERPQAIVVELGANDALRGLDPARVFANLDAIVGRLKERGVAVLLAGMRAPPNMGSDYAAAFDGVFPRVAEKHGVLLYPFFLEGVAARPELNQPDGIHPNARGVAAIVDGILPIVKRLLADVGSGQ